MKIWMDRSIIPPIRANDCTAPVHVAPLVFPSIEEAHTLRQRLLKLSSSLYIRPCLDGKWLVCDPLGAGRLAVLDAHAFFVLEKFRAGNTPLEVAEATLAESLTAIEQFAALLFHLGFLQDTHLPSPNRSQEETLAVWLHVTNACNLRCHYCYISKTQEILADDTARRSVDAIFRSAVKHDFKRVMLKYAGGEASLQADSIFATHDYAVEQARISGIDFHAHLLSNGVFLSQRTIEQLKKRAIAVSISLDGVGAYHDRQRPFINGKGSFKLVDRTITRLLANGIVPHILITVSQHNLPGMGELMEYILERDLSFSISYYRDNECSSSRTELQFSDAQMITTMQNVFTLLEQRLPRQSLLNALVDKADLTHAHKQTCGVGRNYLVIDQRGGIAKCQADIQQTITTIDEDDPLQMLKTDLTGIQNLPVEEKQGCQQCDWRNWCAGGCPLLTYKATGRYDIKSPNCNIYQTLIPEALRLEALRLLAYEEPLVISNEVAEKYSLVV